MRPLFFLLAVLSAYLCRAIDAQPCSIAENGPHHRVWRKEILVETESGSHTNVSSYTELATGLNYWDGAQWQESSDEIEIVADGAAALRGQHRVHLQPT